LVILPANTIARFQMFRLFARHGQRRIIAATGGFFGASLSIACHAAITAAGFVLDWPDFASPSLVVADHFHTPGSMPWMMLNSMPL
jgi:hypothetical protein